MALTSEQQTVIRRALGRAGSDSPRVRKALLLALGVESNYRDVPYGDRDSEGALQQRVSQGWGPASESLETDVDQFLSRARRANRGFAGSAGDLAQSVQRSAFPDRYDARSGEAESILRQFGGGGAAPGAPRATSLPSSSPRSPGQQLAAIVAMAAEPEPPRPSMGLRAPAFAAGPVTPAGALSLPSGAPRESPGAALARALTAIQGFGQAEGQAEPSAAAGAPTGAPVRPGGGFKGTQGVARSLASIGFDLGLKATSTKRHNKNPYSGKNSDHDHGNKDAYAYDISNGSAPTPEMDRAAFRVMRQLGFRDYEMGQPIDTSRGVRTIRTKQGAFRVQVIYRGSGQAFGGNHLNHIHIGVKRVG